MDPTSCRAIMNWAEIELLAGPRLPTLFVQRELGYNEWPVTVNHSPYEAMAMSTDTNYFVSRSIWPAWS